MGLVNYYRRFIPDCLQNTFTTDKYLAEQKKKQKQTLTLLAEALYAFSRAKFALSNFNKLIYFTDNVEAKLTLTTDASTTVKTAVTYILEHYYHKQPNHTQSVHTVVIE